MGMQIGRSARWFACLLATLAVVVSVPRDGVAEGGTAGVSTLDLATLTDLDGLAVSPDGRWAAFLTRRGDPVADLYAQSWHVVATSGGAARRLADGGEPMQPTYLGRINGNMQNPAPAWSPDSRWIAYLRHENGRTQIWRVRASGGSAEQLTRGDADARALVFSADGRRLLYQTEPSRAQIGAALAREGREGGFLYDNRFFPIYSPTPVQPADADFGAFDGRSGVQEAQRGIRVLTLAGRRDRLATAAEAAEFAALTAMSAPEGREHYRDHAARSPAGALAWTEARDADRQGGVPPLTIVAQSNAGDPVVCAAGPCTGQRFRGLWRRNDDNVLFARGEGILLQDTALYAWRVGEAAARLVLRTPDQFSLEYEWKCGPAHDRLVCFYEEPARPRRLVAIHLDGGRVETLFDPNPDFAPAGPGAAPQRLEFRSPTGVENYGYLVLPPDRRAGERLPLVIVTYRCSGFLRGGVGDEYPIFAFAAAGYAVLCFNTPDTDFAQLATMDWTAYVNMMRGEGDPEKRRVQEGLETAIAELDRLGIVDPDRVGLTGLSFGAETVSYALSHTPRLGAAIASSVGFEPADAFLSGPAGRALLRPWGLADPNSPRWNGLALARNAERVRTPFLLNVSDHEMMSSLQPIAALEDARRSVEMYVFPDEYHIKWRPAHRLAIYNRNIDWMNFWLRGVEDPYPAKAAQYARWRVMRENQCLLFGPNGTQRAPKEEPLWYCRR